MGGRAAEILLALIEAGGAVVDKAALVRRAWSGRAVEDSNLAVQIAALRKAFGAEGAEIVVTVAGLGYRLGTAVRPAPAPVQLVPPSAETPTRGPSLVVLPFRSLGEASDQDYLADGIVEDLITALSRIRWFYVLAPNSAFSFKGREVTGQEVGRELGVRYVVSGSLRRAGARVRVNVELIDTADGALAWRDRFDQSIDDVFALQDSIVGSVVAALEPGLKRAEIERLRRRPTELPRAYEAYLRAMARMSPMTRENFDAAIDFFEDALAIDSGFALASAMAAWCRMLRMSQDFPEDMSREEQQAIELAEAALALGSDDPAVLARVGAVFAFLGHRREVAALLTQRAVDLHPNSAVTRGSAGWACLFNGDPETAIVHFEEAVRLDPIDPYLGNSLAGVSWGHLEAGRPELAIRWAERAIAASPEALSGHRAYVTALGIAGRPAQEAVAQLLALDPKFNIADYQRHYNRRPDSASRRLVHEGLRRAGVPELPSEPPRPALKVVRND